jgi:hypothetical protein
MIDSKVEIALEILGNLPKDAAIEENGFDNTALIIAILGKWESTIRIDQMEKDRAMVVTALSCGTRYTKN